MNISVIGDVMLDIELPGRFRENYEGAALCITGPQWRYYPGGAANVAALLRGMGHQVTLFGLMGPDWAAAQLQHLLGRITHFCKPLLPTTIVKLRAHSQQQLIARVDCEDITAVTYPLEAALQEAQTNGVPDAVIFSDYSKGIFGQHTAEAVQRIIGWDCPTVVDPRPCSYLQIWEGATAATPNQRESQQMEIATQYVVVTDGENGAVVHNGPETRHIPTEAVETPQIIGAGDAFAAGLAVGLAEGNDIFEATRLAVSYASRYVAQPRGALY